MAHKKKPKKPVSQSVVCGIAWYREEEWPQLLAVSVDREDLEPTHAEWLQNAQRAVLDFSARGVPVRKVDVGVDELLEWCRKDGRPLDSAARADYAAFKLLQPRTTP
ncbi:MAG: hypothetical protein ABSG68_15665 [Thermoguttaceae bacterium]|jgi:hypothetical protein